MAKVEIIAKLKQKNDADFKIADAKDIEMEDGSDLQSTIDNIKKNGTNIDTEKYATKEELETKANKTDLHEHSNKNVLDEIEQTDIDNWNSKANKDHTHDYSDIANTPTIPSVEGMATEEYVDTAIANAQLNKGEIDTSNFATKDDLNTKVDKIEGYSLVSDDEINRLSSINNYDDTQIKNELNNKSNLGHTHSYTDLANKPTIPSIEGLATEDYVKNEIANAQLSQGEVDLSNYATKNDLDTKVDKIEGYSLVSDIEIVRLSGLDNYDDTEIRNNLNNKSDKGHVHDYSEITNTPTIPSIEGLATENFVKNEIANAQLSGGDIDLSGYATKDELNNKVDKIEGYSLISDSEITRLSSVHNYDDTSLKNDLNNKSDKGHTHDYSEITNPPIIPSIDGLATETYVDTKIAEAQLSGGDVDLSGYATKEELNNKADKTELHGHSNKSILDTITQDKISSWDNKSDFSGKYEDLVNTPTIPTVDVDKSYVDAQLNKKVDKKTGYSLIADTEIQRLANVDNYDDSGIRSTLDSKANKTDLHSHSNKTVLDSLTATKVQEWDNKSEFSGDYNDLLNKPEIPSLDGYATQTYVKNEIANAQLGSGQDVDLSGYATKDDLNAKVDKQAGYSLVADSEIARLSKLTNYDDTTIKNSLNNKVDKKTGYSLISDSEIARLANVDNYDDTDIRKALNEKANKTELHSHSNKTVLDNITASKVTSWDNKSEFSGNYNDLTNKPTIPTKTSQLTNDSGYVTSTELNKKADKTELHSHSNKTVLDGITSSDINNWNNKSSFDGDYDSLTNKPTIPTKTSQLTNDSNFINTTQLNTKVDKKTGYSLVSDSEIARLAKVDNYNDTAIKNTLNNKADKGHTHSYNDLSDKPNIPSIDGLATETFVTTKIAEAQLAQGEIDLSGYATKDDLNNKADKTELHSHSNKTVLDGITSDKVNNWDNKSEFSGDYNDLTNKPSLHSHSNKTILDTITDKKITEWNNKSTFSGNYNDLTNKPTMPTKTSQLTNDSGYVTSSSLHSHSNKTILDGITSDKVTSWDNKSEFSGDYNDLTNKPTIPTVDVNKSYVDTALSKKVDKKTGYSLIADSEIQRLANVDNYDDTNIKNELSKKANSSDLHSHSNKTVLDGITANKVNEWNNKSTFSGNYNDLTNKPTIPTKTSQLTNDSNFATTSQLHNHSNKTILDGITSDKINSWDNKSSFSGSYNDLSDKPTIPVVDSALSSTSTNAIQNKVVKSALDGKANSSHSHTIANITNLQTTLNSKSDTTHTHSYNDLSDKPTIPTVDVTKSYVDAGLNKKVDKKTGYSLVSDSEIERLAGVDNYDDTAIKASINSKANSSDVYTKTQTDNLLSTKANKTDLHSHSNKTVLDSITEEKLTEWDNKSSFSGNYNDLTNKPKIPKVDSALSSTSTNAIQNKVVKSALDSKANSSHTHNISDVTNLQNSLDSKSDNTHTHSYNDLSDKPTIPTMPTIDSALSSTSTNPVQNKVITNALNNKANSSHTHSYNDLTNKPTIPTVTNDLTNELKANYDSAYVHSQSAHAPSNAEQNVQSDWNVTNTTSDAYIKNKPTIPSKTSQLTNDSGYITSSSLHSHSNKTVLDGITAEKVSEWDGKSTFSGNYNDLTNKPTIPKVDSSLSTTSTNAIQNKVVANALNSKANKTDLHSHSNKTVLDSITEEKITEWDNKSDFSGSYNDLTNKPTIPVVDSSLSATSTNAIQNKVVKSALDGKSNTGHTHSYNDLSDKPTIPKVDSALSSTSTNAIQNKVVTNALDGKADKTHTHNYNDLTNKPTIPVVDSALSSTSTNAIQNKVVKSALDGKANSSHTHSISNITNLQTTLDGKSNTNHTHNYAGSSSAGGDATNALACSGNSATASKLQTARTINGTSFDGSANITTSKWGTARNITIGNTTKSVNGSGDISWSLKEIGIYDSIVKIVTNTSELKEALSQGGVIYVISGNYPLANGEVLEYVSNTHLIGLGDVTITINTNSANYIAMRPKLNGTEGGYTAIENFNMSGITFDGKGSFNKAGLFATAHSKNVHIEGCTFKNINNSWHLVEINSSNTVVFDRCTFSDYNYRDIADGDYFTEAVQLDYAGNEGNYPFTCNLDNTGCKNITFNDCSFTRVKTTWTACLGSHLYNSSNGRHENITLNNCTFDDIDNGIYAMGWKNLSVNNTVFNNIAIAIIVEPQADNDGTSVSAIGCRYNGQQRHVNISQFNGTNEGRFIMHNKYNNRLSSSNISNNFIEYAYSHGIGITPVDTTIIGNSVRYCGKHGIYLYGGQQTSIVGNTSIFNGKIEGYTGYDIHVVKGAIGRVWRCNVSCNASYVTIIKTDGYDEFVAENNIKTTYI